MSTYLTSKPKLTPCDPPSRYVGVALLLFGFFNSLGVASAVPVLGAEISSVRLRSVSQGIAIASQSIAACAFNYFTPYLYNVDQLNWGGKVGFFFGGLGLLSYLAIWFTTPETKGRTFSEIDYLFETNTSARKFSTSIVDLGAGHDEEEAPVKATGRDF